MKYRVLDELMNQNLFGRIFGIEIKREVDRENDVSRSYTNRIWMWMQPSPQIEVDKRNKKDITDNVFARVVDWERLRKDMIEVYKKKVKGHKKI